MHRLWSKKYYSFRFLFTNYNLYDNGTFLKLCELSFLQSNGDNNVYLEGLLQRRSEILCRECLVCGLIHGSSITIPPLLPPCPRPVLGAFIYIRSANLYKKHVG